ncbi:hypothetical protein [uncultured Marinococcus sp.]|uniref:hypothetical protein n=1 Tax=uncultured Marinococcus sp. TaxID=487012 RepID=UPI0026278A7E|nr:hypothetical protein [uncultured Marinococcus sp.]
MIPAYLKIIVGILIGVLIIHFLSLFGLMSFPSGYFNLVFSIFLFSMAREFYRQYEEAGRHLLITVMIVVGFISASTGLLSLGLTYGWIR